MQTVRVCREMGSGINGPVRIPYDLKLFYFKVRRYDTTVRKTIKIYEILDVCVCVCVCVRERACVRVCVCACGIEKKCVHAAEDAGRAEEHTLLLLLFVNTKFCHLRIPTISRVVIFAVWRSRVKFCDFAQP